MEITQLACITQCCDTNNYEKLKCFNFQSVSHSFAVPVLKVDLAKNKVLLQIGDFQKIKSPKADNHNHCQRL